MTAQLDAVTFGETMVSLNAMRPVRLRYAPTFSMGCGGAETTFAVAIARMGLRSGWVGRVGDDEFGAYVLNSMRGEQVDVSRAAVDQSHPTGIMFKSSGGLSDGSVYYYRYGDAASFLEMRDLDLGYMTSCRHIHVTAITAAIAGHAPEMVISVLQEAARRGVKTSLDLNVRPALKSASSWQDLLNELVIKGGPSTVFLTAAEGLLLTGSANPPDIVRWFANRGVDSVVVKRGPDGAYASCDGQVLEAPPTRIREVDGRGAGDAFAGGFVAGELLGMCAADSLRLGALFGASVAASSGNVEGLPLRSEVLAHLARDGIRSADSAQAGDGARGDDAAKPVTRVERMSKETNEWA